MLTFNADASLLVHALAFARSSEVSHRKSFDNASTVHFIPQFHRICAQAVRVSACGQVHPSIAVVVNTHARVYRIVELTLHCHILHAGCRAGWVPGLGGDEPGY